MKTTLLVLALSLSFLGSSFAEIREAPTMKSALEGAEEGTLVLFDLDNTVMMAPQALGNEEWFDYLFEKHTQENIKKGMSEKEARGKAIDPAISKWVGFHKTAMPMIPVESDTANLIAGVQAKGAQTMALTGRSDDLAESTREELRSIGVDLSLRAPYTKKLTFKKPGAKTTYEPGLLFCGAFSKGEVLVQFLEKSKLKPKKIIFVDNKQSHVLAVEKALAPTHIPFFGRRHSTADAKIAALDKAVVDLQQEHFFGVPLSNEEAQKLLTK